MKKTVIAWLFVMVSMLGLLYFVGMTVKEQTKEYRAYEGDIREAASVYLDVKHIEMSIGETKTLPIKELIANDLLSKINIDKEKCDGYVEIKRNVSKYTYDSYIKCKNYTTHGYDE